MEEETKLTFPGESGTNPCTTTTKEWGGYYGNQEEQAQQQQHTNTAGVYPSPYRNTEPRFRADWGEGRMGEQPGAGMGVGVGVSGTASGNWVKVFGFDDSYLNRVLEYFQRFGQIAHFSKGKGNWVLLEYPSRVEAQSACKMNGKPIEDKVVIGVVLPDPQEVKDSEENKITTQTPKFDSRRHEPVRYDSWAFKLGEYFFGAC